MKGMRTYHSVQKGWHLVWPQRAPSYHITIVGRGNTSWKVRDHHSAVIYHYRVEIDMLVPVLHNLAVLRSFFLILPELFVCRWKKAVLVYMQLNHYHFFRNWSFPWLSMTKLSGWLRYWTVSQKTKYTKREYCRSRNAISWVQYLNTSAFNTGVWLVL